MSTKYNHKKIESKWQKIWKEKKLYKTKESSDKLKYYVLDMFPYPSGTGLHVGHPKGYIATDVVARMKMMRGFNVLHPVGWDAFGLPAENYALKNKIHPAVATKKNIQVFKKQLGLLGFTYDWDREVNTTDPNYYKWTQWIFLQMFKRGLAYESYEPINWCPSCKTGLANEDLEDGKCERCGSVVEQKPMRQWVLKITDYAERLLKDLDLLDKWPEPIKEMQRNWIGKSEGALVRFPLLAKERGRGEVVIEVFTTRPDTLFGATYVVLAPEHSIIEKLKIKIKNFDEVNKYIQKAKNKTVLERTELQKEKTGVEIKGIKAINPVNNEELPIFVADYVLGNYGTGAIMAVPAHDQRDFEFAKKYNLPIREVVQPLATRIHGEDAFRPSASINEREAVVCVVKHWSEDKYLGVNWTRTAWRGLIIGGIEKGEDHAAAGAREITEETGYKNAEFVGQLGGMVHARFFQLAKQENRVAHFVPLMFKLKNGERVDVDKKESDLHKLEWLSKEEMSRFVNYADMKIIWERACGDLCFAADGTSIDDGVSVTGLLVNSSFLNNLEVSGAKEKIIQWLEEKGAGKRQVQYKLRDWVFSRQRYWGEPIPLVRCEACKNKKYKYILIHAYSDSSIHSYLPWLKSQLESRGHEVISLDLPNTNHPKAEEQAKFILERTELDEKTIIISRSHGGLVAFRMLEEAKKKIRKLILVDAFVRPEFTDKKRPDVEASTKYKFDFTKIKKNCGEIVVLADKNFKVIPEIQSQEMAEIFDAKLVMAEPSETHFRGKKESEVLNNAIIEGWIPVPEKDLPLELPKVKHYEPSGTGESPLANIEKWVNTKCPQCNGPAKRETNTMPQWAGSCWYYLRYEDPNNNKELVDKAKEKYWSPIDLYVGGAEHATRHLIYARFWHKFLYDIGAVSNIEPFTKLQNVGLILAEDGRKMSKRWNNVINPDDVVKQYGADAMRLYEMFMGPFDQPCAWSTQGVVGMKRFIEKVWGLSEKIKRFKDQKITIDIVAKIDVLLNQTIKKVTEDIENLRFNTAISQLMILTNEMSRSDVLSLTSYAILLQLLSPFAPHICEELWNQLGNKKSVFLSDWPKHDTSKLQFETMKLAVQVNGKVRAEIEVATGVGEEEIKSVALADENVKRWLEGKAPKKIIYVKGRLVSVVL